MLSVVCWRWQPDVGYRSKYLPKTVNVLRAMVERWYPHPHRFLCVCDDPAGIDPRVEIVPAWNDFESLPSPHGRKNPSCYRRLRMFHPDIAAVFGERFVSIDLDVVLTGDVSPLWNRPEDFVAYGDTNPSPGSHYNGSMILLRAGSRPQVWNTFNPHRSPDEARHAGSFGSDQAWISYCLGGKEAKFKKADGVYSFRNDLPEREKHRLPKDARVVIFHGRLDPWSQEVSHIDWIKEHYRETDILMAACLTQ